LIPLIIVAYIWRLRRRRRFAVRYSSLALVREALPHRSWLRRHLPFALFLVGLASLVIALGRPVVATRIAGVPELVRPGENGFVVPARDVDALAEAILKVYRSAELRRHLRAGALASRPRFATIPDTAARLAALCARLAGERERC